jgi:hypothetical protein
MKMDQMAGRRAHSDRVPPGCVDFH